MLKSNEQANRVTANVLPIFKVLSIFSLLSKERHLLTIEGDTSVVFAANKTNAKSLQRCFTALANCVEQN